MRQYGIVTEDVMGRPSNKLDETLFEKRMLLNDESGCMEWTGPRNTAGYGIVEIAGRPWLIHRAAWTVFRGPIPSGRFVLHRCDNPPCFNPEHLFIGTAKDNFDDMVKKGRHLGKFPSWAVKGRRIKKLTDDQVREIRAFPRDIPSGQIATHYKVARSTVVDIRNRKRKTLVSD